MDEVQVIIDLIKESPLDATWKFILSIFTVLFISRLKSQTFRQELKKVFVKLFRFLKGQGLQAHYLFLDYKKYVHQAKGIQFACKQKTDAFGMLVDIKFNTLINELRVWIKSNQKCYRGKTKIEMAEEFRQLLKRARRKFEANVLNEYILEFGNEKGRKMYEVIMEGEKGFRAFHYRNFSIMDTFLKNIIIYEDLSNTLLLYKFFGILDTILQITVTDLYTTFSDLNGRLCED